MENSIKPKISEHLEQSWFISWTRLSTTIERYPNIDRMYAIPNGGARNGRGGASLKAEGVTSGIPDLFLPVPWRGYHGLFIEMKAEYARKKRFGGISGTQLEWLDYLNSQDYLARVCYGKLEAIKTVNFYYYGAYESRLLDWEKE